MRDLPGVSAPLTAHHDDGSTSVAPRVPPVSGKVKLQTLSDLDQRTSAYRAAVKLRDEMVDDAGGIDTLSAVKIKLIESVATMTAVIDHYHSLILAGDPQAVPIGELATLTNTRNRTAAMVGLGKSVKTLDLKTYMAETYGDAR